ncbi:MAG: hypothetical protein ACI83Y_000231 [Candidatus Azotimanducaceae bacterium]|jgi:hypothetical protein|tara:strand:- start:567 stop:683 length:117 start_codon:yes stop_codon:yes gene_type:complete
MFDGRLFAVDVAVDGGVDGGVDGVVTESHVRRFVSQVT